MAVRQRADARRNYARILAVAEEEVAAHGTAASLEQIARVTGVGSATVRRHFPTRYALLAAVSQKRIEALAERARALAAADDSRAALLEWLGEVVTYCISARGLAAVLTDDCPRPAPENACSSALEEAAAPLLRRAVQDGAVAEDVGVGDLIALAVGVVLATEHQPDHAERAHRLFRLSVEGLSPSPRPSPR